jgi:RHS repeat-associated protein
VLATISDKKIPVSGNGTWVDFYMADVVTANDYYPGGMVMPGRKFSTGNKYRYGFNGKEKDNEVSGDGNQYDYGFRIYNPRIVRFLSVDPLFKSYPWYTPYQFAGNTPIQAVDLDGLEEYIITTKYSKNGDKKITIEVVTKRGTKEAVNLQYRIILIKDKDGNTTKTGDPLTGKKIVRIVERPDKKPEVSFDDKLTPEEKEVLKNAETNAFGPDDQSIWTINVAGKEYDASVDRDLTKYDEKIAEKTFHHVPPPSPYKPGLVLKDFEGDLNYVAAGSTASGAEPQGQLGTVLQESLEKIISNLKNSSGLKKVVVNITSASPGDINTYTYDNIDYATRQAALNVINYLESRLKGKLTVGQGQIKVIPNKNNANLTAEGVDAGVSLKFE